MKTMMISMLSMMISMSAFAANTLPTIPEDCFEEKTYCKDSDVVEVEGKRVIQVKLFARINAAGYPAGHQEIVNKFFNFAEWPSFVAKSENVKFMSSKEISSITVNNQLVRRHFANYEVKAPFPIRKMEIVETANYFALPVYEGALVSYKFVADLAVDGSKGLKHKVGVLHIAKDEANDEFVLYLNIDVIPAIDLLPKLAAPYIERALMDIFMGMFKIRN